MAVVKNPFAGRYVERLQSAMEDLKPLGLLLSDKLIAALGGDPKRIDGYGKGAIVGTAGELEHCALWHVPGGYAMRDRLGGAKAIVPSATKVGAFGSRLDVPLGHINAAYVRSHFDAMEVGMSDAPRPDEILFCSCDVDRPAHPQPHGRAGGRRDQGLGRAEMTGEANLLKLIEAEPPNELLEEYRLQDQIGFVLRKAHQRHVAIFAARIGDLTPPQFAALAKLADVGETSQNQLGSLIAMDAATVKGVIDRLKARGLVELTKHDADKRRLLVNLTAEGRETVERLIPVAEQITAETLQPLSPKEAATLLKLLARIA